MSSFTEPVGFSATDYFTGGRVVPRTMLLDGVAAVVCELEGASRLYETDRAFTYIDRWGHTITVPAGFRTDLGSIPGVAQWLVARDAAFVQAFILHDWLYRQLRDGTAPKWLTRAKADLIMWDALGLPFQVYVPGREESLRAVCPAALRSGIYWSVRAFGGGLAVENG